MAVRWWSTVVEGEVGEGDCGMGRYVLLQQQITTDDKVEDARCDHNDDGNGDGKASTIAVTYVTPNVWIRPSPRLPSTTTMADATSSQMKDEDGGGSDVQGQPNGRHHRQQQQSLASAFMSGFHAGFNMNKRS